jgi:ribosome biogenesis GTPase A
MNGQPGNESNTEVHTIDKSIETGDLGRVGAIAASLHAESIAEQARELAQRLAEGRFYVACVGQFKRGKSTLIGALIGDNVLPTGFIPVTSVPTVIRYGERRNARIRTENGAWFEVAIANLEQYVSEEHNPENAKKVTGDVS